MDPAITEGAQQELIVQEAVPVLDHNVAGALATDGIRSSVTTESPAEAPSSSTESDMEALSESEIPLEENDTTEGISELSSIHGGSQVGASVTSDFPASYSTFTLRTIDDEEEETGTIHDPSENHEPDSTSVQGEVVNSATSEQVPSLEVESIVLAANGSSSELIMPDHASDKTEMQAFPTEEAPPQRREVSIDQSK